MADRWRSPVSRRRFVGGTAAFWAGCLGLATVGCTSSNNNGNKKVTATAPATRVGVAASPARPVATSAGAATSPTRAAATATVATRQASPTPSALRLTGDVGFGFISSFTGPLAPVYAEFVSGAKLAIDEINEKGGIGGAKLSLVQADDQSNPAQVPAAALGVVDKKLHFCIGPIGSNAISASPALNQGKVIQAGYSDNPELANVSKFPFSFRFVWTPEQSSKLLVDYLTKQQNIDKIAVLGENTVYGQTDLPTTTKYMESVGLKPTLSEFFQPGTADFVPLLRKVQDAGSKAIIWWTQGGPEGITVVKNMQDINLDIPIAGIGLIAGALKGVVSQERLDKTWTVFWKRATFTDKEPPPQKYQDWLKRLDKVGGLGKIGSGGTAPFYDFVYYIKAGIEATRGTDSPAIVKYMESTPFDGIIANYNAITPKDHSVVSGDAISLGVLSSWSETNKVFLKRVPGL